jgi:selenium-binding protein 1
MRTRITVLFTALVCLAMLAATITATTGARPAAGGRERKAHDHKQRGKLQERFLYVSTIAQSTVDPDFIAVIGADPRRPDFGRIVNRVDMPNVGDELHHYGYSHDHKRLLVPGVFSSRIHVFDIRGNGRRLALRAVNDRLAAQSGYAVPHGVMPMSHGRAMVTMIGATSDTTLPGGIVEIDDRTGRFLDHFGPGPDRGPGEQAPKYMYDFESLPRANRGISTTFGAPSCVAGGIEPSCLGNEVYVWDLRRRQVIQTADLGANSAALMVHFVRTPGVRRAFINAPGTSAIWLADDDDRDGVYDFQQVLGPDDGLELPPDMIRDNRRLYVTNSLLTPWDNDPDFGPARNDQYGIWLFRIGENGGLRPSRRSGDPWVSFTNVRRKSTTGPAGPHLVLFDPSIPPAPGEH